MSSEAMVAELSSRRTLRAAFERVRENGGCHGADGVTIGRFAGRLEEELDHLESRLFDCRYRPFPLLRLEIPKPRGGVRHLAVPTVRDRVLQTAVYQVCRELFEAEFEECSYAFRPGRSVKSAIRRVDELRRQGFRWMWMPTSTAFLIAPLMTACSAGYTSCGLPRMWRRCSSSGSMRRSTTVNGSTRLTAALRKDRLSRRCSPISSSTSSTRTSARSLVRR